MFYFKSFEGERQKTEGSRWKAEDKEYKVKGGVVAYRIYCYNISIALR
ncbi:hypothetical protein JW766_03155 [Candidatus Dojkabacteria bacterium]|nr:hypothetical protein [Candidatus Dojkabacteria bacterium]